MADIVIQKSVREEFGSIVSEALWKGTAVIAAPSGGIPAQIEHGLNGYLAESVTSSPIACASCSRTGSARQLGAAGPFACESSSSSPACCETTSLSWALGEEGDGAV